MKKLLIAMLIVLLAIPGCKKDKEDVKQLDFTLTNMTTLMENPKGTLKMQAPECMTKIFRKQTFYFSTMMRLLWSVIS